jgi:superkiller protein 3
MGKPLILIFLAFTATTFFPATALSVNDQEARIIRMEVQMQGLKEQIAEIRKDVKSQLHGQNGNHVAAEKLLSEMRHVSNEIKGLEARLGNEINKKADLKDFKHSEELVATKIKFFIGVPAILISILGVSGIGWALNAVKRIKASTEQLRINTSVTTLITYGNKFHSEEEYSIAIQYYDEAIELDPNNFYAWYYKGLSFTASEKSKKAIEAYNKAIELDPNNFYTWYYKGLSFTGLKEYKKAIEAYNKAIELDPNNSEVWSYKGLSLAGLKEYKKAIEACDKAIELDPNNFEAWYYKGLSFAGLEEYKKAIEAYNKAIELNPNDFDAWHQRGISLSILEEYKDAVEAFDKAIEQESNNPEAWYQKGIAFASWNKYKEAIEAFNKAIKLKPNDSEVWSFKSISLSELKRDNEAIEASDKAIELDPNGYYTWLRRGICLDELKKYREAIEAYDKAIEIDPNKIAPYNALIELQIINNQYPTAIKTIQKAINIPKETKDELILNFLQAIIQKGEGQDTSETENKINDLLEQRPKTEWSFKEIEDWLKTTDLPEDTIEYIEDLTARVKAGCITE